MKRSRGRDLLGHLVRVTARGVLAAVVMVVALAIPLPGLSPHLFLMVYVPLVVVSFLIYIGKLLYDTFFYDRYWP